MAHTSSLFSSEPEHRRVRDRWRATDQASNASHRVTVISARSAGARDDARGRSCSTSSFRWHATGCRARATFPNACPAFIWSIEGELVLEYGDIRVRASARRDASRPRRFMTPLLRSAPVRRKAHVGGEDRVRRKRPPSQHSILKSVPQSAALSVASAPLCPPEGWVETSVEPFALPPLVLVHEQARSSTGYAFSGVARSTSITKKSSQRLNINSPPLYHTVTDCSHGHSSPARWMNR